MNRVTLIAVGDIMMGEHPGSLGLGVATKIKEKGGLNGIPERPLCSYDRGTEV